MKTKHHNKMRITLATGFAMSAIAAMAACYQQADPVNCHSGSVGDECRAISPNCDAHENGTVANLGSRDVVEDGDGKDSTKPNGKCTYGCKISPDCVGKTVTVDVEGSSNTIPDGNDCTSGSGSGA